MSDHSTPYTLMTVLLNGLMICESTSSQTDISTGKVTNTENQSGPTTAGLIWQSLSSPPLKLARLL